MNVIKQKLVHHFERDGIFHTTKFYANKYIQYIENNAASNRIINVGSGGYNQIPGAINIDPYRRGVNTIKAFGETLPFRDNTFDIAICSAVLEHVKEPQLIIHEMYRILKPGGKVYITVPFLQPYHAAPEDYQRWTLNGLKDLMKEFEEIDSGITVGPGSTVGWILVEYVQIFFDNEMLKKISKNIAKVITFPLKYIDKFLINRDASRIIANGFYFYGERKLERKSD